MTEVFQITTTPQVIHQTDSRSWSKFKLLIHNTTGAAITLILQVIDPNSITHTIYNSSIAPNATIELGPIVFDANWQLQASASAVGINILINGGEWFNL